MSIKLMKTIGCGILFHSFMLFFAACLVKFISYTDKTYALLYSIKFKEE